MTHIASDGSNQALLVATGTPVPGTDAETYTASDGTLQEALPVQVAGETGSVTNVPGTLALRPTDALTPIDFGLVSIGGLQLQFSSITESQTVNGGVHGVMEIDATDGDITVTIDSNATDGRVFSFARVDDSANGVSIKTSAGTVNGNPEHVLATKFNTVMVYLRGDDAVIISEN
jgi:hypothetical protein